MKKQMKQRVHHRRLLRITQKTLKVQTSFGVQTLSVLFLFVQFHVQYLLVQSIKVAVATIEVWGKFGLPYFLLLAPPVLI